MPPIHTTSQPSCGTTSPSFTRILLAFGFKIHASDLGSQTHTQNTRENLRAEGERPRPGPRTAVRAIAGCDTPHSTAPLESGRPIYTIIHAVQALSLLSTRKIYASWSLGDNSSQLQRTQALLQIAGKNRAASPWLFTGHYISTSQLNY